MAERVAWVPQKGPQTAAFYCPAFEVFYGGARGGGKCLPLDEPVLTPFGWRAIGAIKPGNQVCNPDGSVSRVIASYRPGLRQVFRLTFSDGATVRCDAHHIWLGRLVSHKIKRDLDNRLFTTAQILAKLESHPGSKFIIPLTKPVAFTRPRANRHGDMRPLDPYLLGVLLGDGSLTGCAVRYSTEDREIDEAMSAFGVVRVDDGPNRRLINCPDVIAGLKRLGVWGKRADEKRVSDAYLWAGVESRWSVLQGLMDTDGTADARGQCYFASASKGLAEDVVFLARSLGFKASLWVKATSHLPSWQVYIRGPERVRLFRLERKRLRAEQGFQPQHSCRRLVSIVPDGVDEVACFKVDNPNGLFITRDFIVTHNTDWAIGVMGYRAQTFGSKMRGLFVRRTLVQLTDAIRRAKEIYRPMLATWRQQDKTFVFPNGAEVSMAYLERDDDAENYQGWSLTDVSIEELGNFPDPAPVLKLMATLRSAEGVPVQFRATGNPGGPGQHWIKQRYIEPAPLGMQLIPYTVADPFGSSASVTRNRVFIPAKLNDNPILLRNDPNYVANLAMQASPELVRAWLQGDWDAIVGAFFPEFTADRHVLRPLELPDHWTRFLAMDWGSARPFAVLWFAVSDGELSAFPRGALIVEREWYGMQPGQPNVGLKLPVEDVARGIVERQARSGVVAPVYQVADPAMFTADGGPSMAERMYRVTEGKVNLTRADNARVAQRGAMGGWDQVRARLRGDADGRPMLYVFANCSELIRTLPAMQHDKDRPEDLDTDGEDHAVDALRYGCMSRPMITEAPVTQKSVSELLEASAKGPTFDQLIARRMRERRETYG